MPETEKEKEEKKKDDDEEEEGEGDEGQVIPSSIDTVLSRFALAR